MSIASIDLDAVARRLADRAAGRSEATVQSDVRLLLLAAGLNLLDGQLEDVVLEAPVGKLRRIDVEVGATVIEVKRDLRVGNVRAEAVPQLAGYVRDRTATTGARYTGILTDGAEWLLFHLLDGVLSPVSRFELSPTSPDTAGLTVWLDGVLATATDLTPTPREIARRLGATSTAHALDAADLRALYRGGHTQTGVRVKRELWAKLLTTALGTAFTNEDELFLEHTLLVVTAELIGHAVIGFDLTDQSLTPASLTRGQLFSAAQIRGVVEEDFFDWVIEVPGGADFVRTLARRLSRFTWDRVEHDVMKVLYESVISARTRHDLGEYYTPDWLAEVMVTTAVTDPLRQRVLDPACGSGTFVFHAVRAYLAAAAAAGQTDAEAMSGATGHVYGMDVHPVAATFARVTYLLALGRDRLTAGDRPPLTIPVYLGDSVQWGQDQSLLTGDALTVHTGDGVMLFADQLRFPDRLVADAARFDGLVADLADAAARDHRPPATGTLRAVFRRYTVDPADEAMIAGTYQVMCELHDTGRDHIWGYYVRNLARPVWLSRPANRVDVLVGNPPWLSYRYMPPVMKADFRAMSTARGFWAGAAVATHQDLSALFVARAVEQYLAEAGTFSFVMPLAVLTRKQFAGFRTGAWSPERHDIVTADLHGGWDLHAVKPSFFPVPAAVVTGTRRTTTIGAPTALTGATETWAGTKVDHAAGYAEVEPRITRTATTASPASATRSPYAPRFSQGATLVPRFLVLVQNAPAGPLGAGQGRTTVRSSRSTNEKPPWKQLPDLPVTAVERQFIRPILVGDTVLPFRLRPPAQAVIPWDGTTLDQTTGARLDQYPGLASWWRAAADVWTAHRTPTSTLSLLEQLDYRNKLRAQLPSTAHRVVYTKSGAYLAAAYIDDPRMVVDHKLYWATVTGPDEARYLTAVLNSPALLAIVQPLQSLGDFGPRDFDKYVWQVPIPLYEESAALHRELVDLAVRAEQVAAGVDLPQQSFQALRRRVRQALIADGVSGELDQAVTRLLT